MTMFGWSQAEIRISRTDDRPPNIANSSYRLSGFPSARIGLCEPVAVLMIARTFALCIPGISSIIHNMCGPWRPFRRCAIDSSASTPAVTALAAQTSCPPSSSSIRSLPVRNDAVGKWRLNAGSSFPISFHILSSNCASLGAIEMTIDRSKAAKNHRAPAAASV